MNTNHLNGKDVTMTISRHPSAPHHQTLHPTTSFLFVTPTSPWLNSKTNKTFSKSQVSAKEFVSK